MNHSLRKGFTLIELLIVVAIIGILASIVLIGLRGVRESGRDARRITDLRNMGAAFEQYFNACSIYPGDGACATIDPSPDSAGWLILESSLKTKVPSITAVPHDPLCLPAGSCPNSGGAWRDYNYAPFATHRRYVVSARLEDANNQILRTSPRDPISTTGSPPASFCGTLAVNPDIYCVVF